MKYRYRQKKNLLNTYKIFIFLVAAISIFLIFQLVLPKTKVSPVVLLPEFSTSGYLKTDVDAGVVEGNGVVILTSGCYQLSANTEASQAESIADGIAKTIGFRPNTHDLMRDTLDNLGVEVVMVKIVDIKNNTFYGRLILKQGNKVVSLDSRPSDGIALAVRTDAPVYLKEELMKSQGKYIC